MISLPSLAHEKMPAFHYGQIFPSASTSRILSWGLICFLFGNVSLLFAQNGEIRGYVWDESGEAIVGATVMSLPGQSRTLTNSEGYFMILGASDGVALRISHVSFQPDTFLLDPGGERPAIFRLRPYGLQTVQIVAPSQEANPLGELGVLRLPVETVNRLPAFLGEKDIIQVLALTPGVQTGTNGTSNLLVRGGSQDQNLVLVDGVPIYNLTHLFGLISILNSDAVKQISLYKGSFPARYGGRLSSVLDVQVREGRTDSLRKQLSLGLLASRFQVEGGFAGGRGGFLLAGRASYLGLLAWPFRNIVQSGGGDAYLNYWLVDANLKAHAFLDSSRTHKLALNVYGGHDQWTTESGTGSQLNRFGLGWGNQIGSLTYSHLGGKRWIGKAWAYVSRYQYALQTEQIARETIGMDSLAIQRQRFRSEAGVLDIGTKYEMSAYLHPQLTLEAGGELIRHQFQPAAFETVVGEAQRNSGFAPIQSWEAAWFAEGVWQPSPQWEGRAGLRNSFYWVDDQSYVNWEPRLSLGWEFRQGFRAKAAFSRMSQYLHLLSSSGAGVPNDIWIPATATLPPAIAQQVGLSLEKNWPELGVSASLEAYRKTFIDLPGFERGANLLRGLDENWEANLLRGGEGRVHGLEGMISREGKAGSGWVAYTLMRSERRFLEESESWFPDRFDRRHMFSAVWMMPIKRSWTFTCAFRYLTGTPITAPIASQRDADGNLALIYGERGNVRMPANHRLDISWERRFRNSEGKERSMNLGIYNLYNRQNPFYIESVAVSTANGGSELQWRQQSLFPILPSVSYSWYW